MTDFGLKKVVVTGGNRGIGREIALNLARNGAKVVVVGRDKTALERTQAELSAAGLPGLGLSFDLTDPTQVEQMGKGALDFLGGVDVLVNCAGGSHSANFLTQPDALWDAMIRDNLTSVYYTIRAFLPAMVSQRWGRIVSIGSVSSRRGVKRMAAYAAAKHGLVGLSRSLAVEVAEFGVTVNVVCPGYVDVPRTYERIEQVAIKIGGNFGDLVEQFRQANPQGRFIEPAEIAEVVLFLIRNGGINGEVIGLDGGLG